MQTQLSMSKTKENKGNRGKKYDKPVSLYPLETDKAIKLLLKYDTKSECQ